MKKILQGYRI